MQILQYYNQLEFNLYKENDGLITLALFGEIEILLIEYGFGLG